MDVDRHCRPFDHLLGKEHHAKDGSSELGVLESAMHTALLFDAASKNAKVSTGRVESGITTLVKVLHKVLLRAKEAIGGDSRKATTLQILSKKVLKWDQRGTTQFSLSASARNCVQHHPIESHIVTHNRRRRAHKVEQSTQHFLERRLVTQETLAQVVHFFRKWLHADARFQASVGFC